MNEIERAEIDFTQVGNKALRDKNLSLRAKGLYAYLYSKPKKWQFSGDRICGETKDGRKVCYATLLELEKNGYLHRNKQSNGRMKYFLDIDPTAPKGQQAQKPNALLGKLPFRQVAETGSISNTDLNTNTDEESNTDSTNPEKEAKRFFSMAGPELTSFIAKLSEKYKWPIESTAHEVGKFRSYWMELNKVGTKQRWQSEKHFEVKRRFATWFGNVRITSRNTVHNKYSPATV